MDLSFEKSKIEFGLGVHDDMIIVGWESDKSGDKFKFEQ